MTVFGYRIPAFAAVLLWGALWEAIGQSGSVFILPPLSSVLIAFVELIQRGNGSVF
jgi:NitT/TauT family transport system permease protein